MTEDVVLSGPCTVGPVVDLLFSRWTTPILWELYVDGPLRFVELEDRTGARPKVLTERLRQLERDGLVSRRRYAESPPRVDYDITDLGRSLQPVFATLGLWAEQNLPAVITARAIYRGPLPR